MRKIAQLMSEKVGFEIKDELIVKLPDDGCTGHLGSPYWAVYAARAGEFTILAYVYAGGDITIIVV